MFRLKFCQLYWIYLNFCLNVLLFFISPVVFCTRCKLKLVINMKLSKWLENWGMMSLKIKAPFLEMEWQPKDEDKAAAWELYIELITRVTTQNLSDSSGSEKTALDSVYQLFPITRDVIKSNGRNCIEFTKIAVIVLNQIVRPFTSKWHLILASDNITEQQKNLFRQDLKVLQLELVTYSKMLADLADVEDLSDIITA